MPDREGKTLDISPVGLLGCAEVEDVTRRLKEISPALVRVQPRNLCILSFIVTSCSLEKSAEGFSMVHDAEKQSANSRASFIASILSRLWSQCQCARV